MVEQPTPGGEERSESSDTAGNTSTSHGHELTWEMVEALEEVLDHWELSHSPLDDAGLHRYTLARLGLNHLRDRLPPR